MKKQEKTGKYANRCHICGNLVGGTIGMDFEIIENRGQKRFYCEKCMKKLMRGE